MKKIDKKKVASDEQKILNKLKNLPSIHAIEKQISREGLFRVKPEFRPLTGYVDSNQLRKYYHELIKEKTLKNDKRLMDDIIKLRTKILQHRMSCDISLYEKGILVASLKIYKILIEHGQDVVDYWINKSIDPSGFSRLINDFYLNMRGKNGTGTVNVSHHPIKRHTVDAVSTEFEFS